MKFVLRASLRLWERRLAYRRERAAYWHNHFNDARAKRWRQLVAQAEAKVARRRHQLRPRGVSVRGVNFIKQFEGFRGRPYRDAVNVWTIGYGHTQGVGPNSAEITEHQASKMLKADLDRIYAPPVLALGLDLRQTQLDALVSFVYNLGPGVIEQGHTMGDALHRHDFKAAADAFLLYDKAGGKPLPGLTARRRAERALFLS